MCGIAGLFDWRGGGRVDRAALRAATRALRHRGPDDEGFFEDGSLGLGHRRLSIIDLDGGRQPIANEDGSVVVVFNGEIYNYRELRKDLEERGHVFRTLSDTETIVHLYEEAGEGCVEKLRGMFAFALFDRKTRTLLLARDRFGVKPLFLSEPRPGVLAFASEAGALRFAGEAGPAECDPGAIAEYLRFRFVAGPRTLLRSVRKLAPGHVLVATASGVRERAFWDVPAPEAARGPEPSAADFVEECRERLAEAVRIRLVADVPLGAFLSGGLDSSLLVALMRREGVPRGLCTFSVGVDDPSIDESAAARATALALGAEHTEVRVSWRDLDEKLERMIERRDGPLSEPSDLALYSLAEAAARRVKVVLSGEGADEVFGGYAKYVVEGLRPLFMALPGGVRKRVVGPLAAALPGSFRRVRATVRSLACADEAERFADYFASAGGSEIDALLEPDFLASAERSGSPGGGAALERSLRRVAGAPRLFRMQYADLRVWLPDNLLERGDRLTMAHSLEGRVPYLDHPLVEFASRVPPRLKVRGLATKRILREVARGLVPDGVLGRKKIGFAVPIGAWLRGPLRARAADVLSSRAFRSRGIFRPEATARLLDEHASGRRDHGRALWAMLNLEAYFASLERPSGTEPRRAATQRS